MYQRLLKGRRQDDSFESLEMFTEAAESIISHDDRSCLRVRLCKYLVLPTLNLQ